MPRRLALAAVVAAAPLMAAPAAHALDWILGQPIMAPQQMWSLMDDADLGDGKAGAAARLSLTYAPDAARTRANLADFVARSRAADPAGADALEQSFAGTDVIGAIGAAMRQAGLDKNNMADAYAVWAVNAWSAAHGDLSETPPATLRAVADQVALAFLNTPDLAGADDAAKQQLAETLLVQAALISANAEAAAGDAALSRQVARAVRQGASASGLDLDRIRLTATGFAAVKD